jgi:putative oxidoreductase
MGTIISKIGKVIYAILMGLFGIFHFGNADSMKGMVPNYFPAPIFWVYLTGVALILAAIAIIINKKGRLAAILLGVMLIIFALTIHLPGAAEGNQVSSSMFLKDLALAGAAFAISGALRD